MGGGYFSCRPFMGEDKSGTAFFEMIADIEAIAYSSPNWSKAVAAPLKLLLSKQRRKGNVRLELPSALVLALEPFVRNYCQDLSNRLGDPDPVDAPSIGEFKTGEGWRLYCAWDFLRAADACREYEKSVVLHFD